MNTNTCTPENLGPTNVRCDSHGNKGASVRQANKRLAREWRTIEAMVHIYCRDHHQGGLCLECKGFLDYAAARLDRCRFGTEKPTCAKCPVHCYRGDQREYVKKVMRYAGPRMLWKHPILSFWHWLESLGSPATPAF